MASAQWADNYNSTLASGYTSGGSSLVVTGVGTGASTLPTSGDYYVLVEADGANSAEVFKVTARSGTTLTVVGAQAGTGASNHGSGATIRATIIVKAALDQFAADIIAAGATSYAPATPTVNAQTGTSYTLLSTDNGKIVTMSNAAAITLTVPSGLGAGFSCLVIQLAAGKVTPTASGTTLVQRQSYTKTAGQYAVMSLVAYAANTFAMSGDMGT